MADEASAAGASSSRVAGESSESSIEINVKTLDSKVYTFQVNKEMPVAALKVKLVDATGVPVERQRLIFRGKVLKDDHLLSEYQLEDGHTLHLVARQPVQGQPSLGTASEGMGQDNNGQGNDSTSGAYRNRIGPASHGVLFGTVNIADQGDSMVADIGRLVGAVLSSLGIGGSAPNGTASDTSPSTASNQVLSSGEAVRNPNASSRSVSGNPASPSFTVPNYPVQTLHQIPQISPNGLLSRNMIIPDSLTTLSEFISRMELALQNGSDSSSSEAQIPPGPETPSSNARGLPSPETLRTVLEQAQQLLRGNAATQLSNIASRLEREGTSTDLLVRGQIQTEAMRVGVAMQHLGAMLLELGRTMMTLRMGQSPSDSSVNAGPAVYVSSTGPNPIMVQPFPLQANSLFGVSSPPLVSGISSQFTSGDPSRNINIHIHAGTRVTPSVSSAATRTGSGEATNRESSGPSSRGDSNSTTGLVPTHGLPPRTVVAAIPARATAQTAGHILNVIYPVHVRSQLSGPVHSVAPQVSYPPMGSGPQSNTAAVPPDTMSTLVAQISAQVANALAGTVLQGLSSETQNVQSANVQGSHVQTSQTPPEPNTFSGNAQGQSSSPDSQYMDRSDVEGNASAGNNESTAAVPHIPEGEGHQTHEKSSDDSNICGSGRGLDRDVDPSSTITITASSSTTNQFNDTASNSRSHEKFSEPALPIHAAQSSQGSNSDRPTPLGLGLGGLQPKRRGKTSKPVPVEKDKSSHETVNQNQQSIAMGQEILQSLASQSSNEDRANSNDPSNPLSSLISQVMDGMPSGRQVNNGQGGQGDAAGMMSHILQTPAFNNFLTGVASQTGIGPSSDLRTMLEQCTQSPAVRNMLNQIEQQVDGQSQNLGAIFSGAGRGEGGGLDFSRMIQQMLPAVSQALGRGPTQTTSNNGPQPDNPVQHGENLVGQLQNLGPMLSGGGRGDAGGLDLSRMIQQVLPAVSQALGRDPTQMTSNDGLQLDDAVQHGENLVGDRVSLGSNSEVDLEFVVDRIEQNDTPGNVFHSMLESVGHLFGDGNGVRELVNELGDNDELITEFVGMLRRDLNRRMQSDSAPER